jgi:ABC-type glutathione transport system ATPase component
MNHTPLLRVHLDAGYSGKTVLRDVRFSLQPGQVLGLVGGSGAGKSTLVLALLGLLQWRGGSVAGLVALEGQDLLSLSERSLRTLRGRDVAFIPQSPMSALNPAISLRSHFHEAWRAHRHGENAQLDARINELLCEVQLPFDNEFLRRRPSQISVGQAQRVLIALALLHHPKLVIADEPTSALDPVTQAQIIELLRRVNQHHGTALLYISHDLVSVLQLSDRIAMLHEGTIVETLAVSDVSDARHPAMQALLRALPAPPEVLLRYRNRGVPAQSGPVPLELQAC